MINLVLSQIYLASCSLPFCEELDPVAKAWHEAVTAGQLSTEHIFYKMQKDILEVTMNPNHHWKVMNRSS